MGKYAREQAHGSPIVAVQQCGQPATDIEQRLREAMDGVTPLEWVPWLDNGSVQAHTPFGSYTVEAPDEEIDRVGWSWRYCFAEYYDEDTFTCDDLESGKRAAQDNWNERMFQCVNMDTIASLRSKLEEAEGACGWRPIETAPKDGTRVWLKNGQMRQPIIGQMNDYRSEFSGTVSRQWIVTHDPYDRFMPLQYGSLCVPSHWMPLASLREADHA